MSPTSDISPKPGGPRLLVATRFGLGIHDAAWFEHRLALMAAITVPSLLAQDDQEFEWGIFAGPDLPEDVRHELDELLAPFEGRAFIDSDGHTPGNLLKLAVERRLVHPSGHVLTGRIDDDDAWAITTVGRIRAYAGDWLSEEPRAPGLGLTFETGVVWVMYDMLDIERLQAVGDRTVRPASLRSFKHAWTSISEFVCSPLSLGLTPIKGSHALVPHELSEAGFDVRVVPDDEPMWLYCRHKQTDSAIERSTPDDRLDMSIDDLERIFGIDGARTEAFISSAGRYGYSTKKRLFDRRGELQEAFTEAEGKVSDPTVNELEVASLARKASRRREEWARLGHDLIAAPSGDAAAIGFCHVIQTPFCDRTLTHSQEPSLDRLNTRLRLLDAYCLPSLATQDCGDFIWQVYCDEATDASILEALHDRAKRFPQMRVAITGPNGRNPAAHVLDDTRLVDTVLVTTRLDNASALAKGCVRAIHGHVDRFGYGGKDSLVLDFPRGYRLDPASGSLALLQMPHSSCPTLFERLSAEPATVLSGNPPALREQHDSLTDSSIPAWLLVGEQPGEPDAPGPDGQSEEVDVRRLDEFGLALDQPRHGHGQQAAVE